MKKNWVLSQEDFDALLDWLAPDRDQAGLKYEAIRRRLITIFTGRRCPIAEDLTDETINRVASKLAEVRDTYEGDPALYFYATANYIHQEYLRKKPPEPPPPNLDDPEELEERFRCLEDCLGQLTAENRELVVEYYQDDKSERIFRRKRLAERLGIAPNALRIRACRIRTSLEECLEKCLGESVN
jgi:RNA polymerase sigma factor (sigma-70 family)